MTMSQKSNEGIPSIRNAASKAINSASDELCDTAPCFLQNQVIGTKVLGPMMTIYIPDVDLLSLMSPAKLASTKQAI